MPLPNSREVFLKLIESLAEAASCARQLAFLRGQNEWLKVDEMLVRARKNVIELAEAKERGH
jgi:hypothetical protein